MGKKNCWEHKNCGRWPDGPRSIELGICPVTTDQSLEGVHQGSKAGRACWVVAGSLCGGRIQGTYAQKLSNCWRCDFMNQVKKEEEISEIGFSHTRLGMKNAVHKTKDAGSNGNIDH